MSQTPTPPDQPPTPPVQPLVQPPPVQPPGPPTAPLGQSTPPPAFAEAPPPGYQAWTGDAPTAATSRTDGKLIAAGVLCLISGGVTGLIGLWLFSLTTNSDTAWVDDLSGGAITLMALFMTGIAAVYITAGVGSVRGRNWGRITAIVINAIFVVLTVIGFAAEPNGGSIVPLAWCGTIIGLAWAGTPNRDA